MTTKTTRSKALPVELRERAVRLVREQEGDDATRAAIRSVAAKVGCHAETLRLWLRDADPKPFTWTATPASILERLDQTNASVH